MDLKRILGYLLLLAGLNQGIAQENITYQKPPQEILELVDIQRAPAVSMDNKKEQMLLLYRNAYKTLAELGEEEMKLGGLRINPKTNISSTIVYYTNIKFKRLKDKEEVQVKGLPENPKITNINWAPDETKVAFTHTTGTGVEAWLLDLKTLTARRLTEPRLNANLGNPLVWVKDGNSLLIRMLPADRKPLINTLEALPEGPTVTVSTGAKAQNRTYQDLLKNRTDEANFETLVTSEIYNVSLNGRQVLWKPAGMYTMLSPSPGGDYYLVATLKKPFSYLVTYQRFSSTLAICDASGTQLSVFNEKPLIEDLPKGFMAVEQGKRSIMWRADKPATLYWTEALDGGNPETPAEYRDAVFDLAAPFTGTPRSVIKLINRCKNIFWGNDNIAIAEDYWWNTRNQKTYLFNPSDNSVKPQVLFDRNYQDVYSDPGDFEQKKNAYNRYVLDINGDVAYLTGNGFTDKGQFPFIDAFNLKTKAKTRLYQSKYTDKKESLNTIIDAKKGLVLVQQESKSEYPNYYIINIKKNNKPVQVTFFDNPFKKIAGVSKEVIKYKRADGLELTGTLYLPLGYDKKKKEKLPMVMWAYPTEYKDKNSASQNTANPNEFTYPYYGSPVYWVTRGYAVLDDAAFPIVGEGKTEPNDSFIDQLVADAKAAIDAVDALGYIDRNRVAVGGHSYGAFMTANLLTHCNLFAAGIARSGAYNRTLTPFGFQSEERNYWEVPEVYNAMSPFMHADKMKTPLLLVHGDADNNPGTFTIQSERYFNALKGFGAPTRLVLLPKESHSYAAIENILHLLWEQDQWLEKYVKNRK
ncbi:MAG: prolyl oligopeptidase family serine peptidase [Bacteroidia bacterium]